MPVFESIFMNSISSKNEQNQTWAIKHVVVLVPKRNKINLGELFCKWFQFSCRKISLLKDTFFWYLQVSQSVYCCEEGDQLPGNVDHRWRCWKLLDLGLVSTSHKVRYLIKRKLSLAAWISKGLGSSSDWGSNMDILLSWQKVLSQSPAYLFTLHLNWRYF